ncbi:MAG: hypothetical protein AB8B67_05030 [Rickettsiaceae bacterium]
MKEKLYMLLKNVCLITKYSFIFIKLFFIKLRVKVTRNNWYLSKNHNYYNPTLAATVYRYGRIWKIARHDNFFGNFENKNDAMASIFQEWLEENEVLDTIDSLQITLKNTKQKIFGNSRNNKDDQEKTEVPINKNYRVIEKSENDINFISKYFYLAQTTQSCYKCQKNILVNAIVLPEGFETIDHNTIEDLEQQGIHVEDFSLFCSQDYQSILSYLTYISSRALEKIYDHVDEQLFKKEYSFSTNYEYYRSICNYCGSAQGDHFVISEYNSAFYPVNMEDFKKIKFYKINQEIKALAGSNSIGYGCFSNSLISVRNIYKK